jgi:hypothetical protein
MADTDAQQPITKLDRHGLIRILSQRLQHRWLESPAQILVLTETMFGERTEVHQQFATLLSQAFRERKLRTTADLDAWLTQSKLLKRLFRKSKKIEVQSFDRLKSQGFSGGLGWSVPPIATEVQLSEFLLLGSHRIVDWLTLPHRRRATDVTHYKQRLVAKRNGTKRIIESPRPILKRTQRIIASRILSEIPLHKAAMGFRLGASVQDCAALHVGRDCVLRIDLQDFFGTIHFGRVRSLFSVAGYPKPVANRLAMLCTAPATLPDSKQSELRSRLPQGAPTSPALANAVCFGMDRRLAALASAADAAYTRYADDLIFSLDSRSIAQVKRLATTVAVIAMEEGFAVNFRKTRIMRSGNVQRVLGMSVNQRLNVPRKHYETLKAILHNCIRFGPASQNRDSHPHFERHLRGRISHVASIHPQRGAKLLKMHQRVDWSNAD